MKKLSDKLKLVYLAMVSRNMLKFLPDKLYLKILYRIKIGKKLDLKNPQTFNEKLQWLKLYDRKDIYTTMVDKYEVRKYIKEKIGEEYLIPLIGVYNSFDEIDFDKLPDQFVIKCTHDSGSVIVCKDKSKFNIEKARKKINKALKRNYYYICREWPYKNVKPRIIIEEYISELSSDDLKDYKLFVFNNKLAYSFICSDRNSDLKFTFFDKNRLFLDFTQDNCPYDSSLSLPREYNKLVELALKLSKTTIQVRVDFYIVNGKIYFGEMTFFDSGGFGKFYPEEWDKKIGDMLDIKLVKKNEKKKSG